MSEGSGAFTTRSFAALAAYTINAESTTASAIQPHLREADVFMNESFSWVPNLNVYPDATSAVNARMMPVHRARIEAPSCTN